MVVPLEAETKSKASRFEWVMSSGISKGPHCLKVLRHGNDLKVLRHSNDLKVLRHGNDLKVLHHGNDLT